MLTHTAVKFCEIQEITGWNLFFTTADFCAGFCVGSWIWGKEHTRLFFDKGCGLVQLTGGGHSLPARKRAGARFDSQLAKVLYSSAGSAHCTLGTRGYNRYHVVI
jgi:hypothetical protein